MKAASIICVDLIIRRFPGNKNFKIEDSNHFLSSGLSLSFGVMVWSPSTAGVKQAMSPDLRLLDLFESVQHAAIREGLSHKRRVEP